MAMYHERLEARKLRKRGLSINAVKDILGVSKGTVSLWCRDIVLTPQQRAKLEKSWVVKTERGRLVGALANKRKRLVSIEHEENIARRLINRIGEHELTLIATALYWSEGSKSESSTGFQFVNSDPKMILIIKHFLRQSGIKNEDLVCTVQINEVHRPRINQVLSFWKNLLDLQNEQVKKPYFVKTKNVKIYENHNSYFGICRLKVRRSTALKYRMLGLIKALKSAILPT